MAGIAEQGRPINDSEDYTVSFQCGCRVVFTGKSFHRSFLFTACIGHVYPDLSIPCSLVEEALTKLRMDKMNQGPR